MSQQASAVRSRPSVNPATAAKSHGLWHSSTTVLVSRTTGAGWQKVRLEDIDAGKDRPRCFKQCVELPIGEL
jgi:hypothetical protein